MKNTLLILGYALLLPLFCFGQSHERLIDFPKMPVSYNLKRIGTEKPVQTDERALGLVEIKIEGKSVLPEQSFTAGDDWLKGLSIKLKNISDKPISSIIVSFSIPNPSNDRNEMGLTLKYNQMKRNSEAEKEKLIMPDETVELEVSEKQYEAEKNVWMRKMDTAVFNRILLGSIIAIFEDGSSLITIKPTRAQ